MKKKLICCILTFTALFTVPLKAAALEAQSAPNITVIIDGKVQEFKDGDGNRIDPVIINGKTYLPVASIGDAFGKSVSWDGSTSTITIGSGVEKAVNLIDVISAKAIQPQWNIESSHISKVSGEESLTFSQTGDAAASFQTAIKISNIDNATKDGYYEINGSYSTLSCTLLFVPDAATNSPNDGATVQISNMDTGVDIINQTLEPNKLVQISDADITGIQKLGIAGTRTTVNWNGTLYILNPTVK